MSEGDEVGVKSLQSKQSSQKLKFEKRRRCAPRFRELGLIGNSSYRSGISGCADPLFIDLHLRFSEIEPARNHLLDAASCHIYNDAATSVGGYRG